MKDPGVSWRVAVLAATALCAFAANSLLCRLALRDGHTDPATFTGVRLVSGAVLLAALVGFGHGDRHKAGSWVSGLMLWLYAAAFSYAYLGLTAGTGALLLFGAVQVTMIGHGLMRAEGPKAMEWVGLLAGLAGLTYLVLPGVSAPPLWAAALMLVAGAAWGVYSIRGRSAADPLGATAGNFLWSVPLALALAILASRQAKLSPAGVTLAALSGAVTSGLGYVAWYAAVRSMTSTKAAVLQLSVPVLTAFAGVLFLGETLTVRLVVASVVVLGGVALAVAERPR